MKSLEDKAYILLNKAGYNWEEGWNKPSLQISKKFCGVKTGIVGAYLAFSNKILLMEFVNDTDILPTLCHELVHAIQRDRYGLLMYLLRKTFTRKKIEEEADKVTKFVEEYLTNHTI